MPKKILVVDDDPGQREVIRATLNEAGFDVSTATDGIEGLKKAHAESPDMIVLDVMMPQMDGFAVCATLREDETTAAIPILMLTGLCSYISQLTGIESGATDYLVKPYELEQLVSKVEALLCQPSGSSKAPCKSCQA
jgi:DNA-binding response OmpR family regulator